MVLPKAVPRFHWPITKLNLNQPTKEPKMPSRRKRLTEDAIKRKLKAGFGSGFGPNYKPYLLVTDVPSRGTCTIIYGWKHGREHHLLSRLERNYFYVLEWDDQVTDTREQFPLTPISSTLEIARELGIRHPSVHRSPIMMTTDFLLTLAPSGASKMIARAVKPEKELSNARVLEKLEIERHYFAERGIEWDIVTEKDIPEVVWRNVDWVHECRDAWKLCPITSIQVELVKKSISRQLQADRVVRMADMCLETDAQLGLVCGTSLKVLRHLIANKIVLVDINVRLRTDARPRFQCI
jgi:hypothetical protein